MSSSGWRRSLPLGVAVIAVIIALFGVIYVLFGLLAILLHLALGGFVPHFGGGIVADLVIFIVGIVLLVIARGLWETELWALVLCILVVGALWLGDLIEGAWLSLGAIVLFLVLLYLVAVHRHFR
jgi:hypothetical protein